MSIKSKTDKRLQILGVIITTLALCGAGIGAKERSLLLGIAAVCFCCLGIALMVAGWHEVPDDDLFL